MLPLGLWPSGRVLVPPGGVAFFANIAFRWLGRRRRLVTVALSAAPDCSAGAQHHLRAQVIRRVVMLLRMFHPSSWSRSFDPLW